MKYVVKIKTTHVTTYKIQANKCAIFFLFPQTMQSCVKLA